MNIQPDINTDFNHFDHRAEDCQKDDCSAIFILERRVDRHRLELNELKEMLQTTNENVSEVLDTVRLAKGFFKVRGWIGNGIKLIAAVGVPIAAFIYWLKFGDKP